MSVNQPEFKSKICLYELSKNIIEDETSLELNESVTETCAKPNCTTFETIHRLKFYIRSNQQCDSEKGKILDGVIVVEKLVTALINDGLGRGFHQGDFIWYSIPGSNPTATGQMVGITNAGKYRDPLKECESCDIKGRMEGRITGTITDGNLKGCEIYGSYIIEFKPNNKFDINQHVRGTLEGLIKCSCDQ